MGQVWIIARNCGRWKVTVGEEVLHPANPGELSEEWGALNAHLIDSQHIFKQRERGKERKQKDGRGEPGLEEREKARKKEGKSCGNHDQRIYSAWSSGSSEAGPSETWGAWPPGGPQDLSDGPHLSYGLSFTSERIGSYDVQLVEHFFQFLVNASGMTLHIRQLAGRNSHNIAEAAFKAFALALRLAAEPMPRV